MVFPFDFSFNPVTLGGWTLHYRALAHVRCVAIHSYDHEPMESIDELDKNFLSQFEEFFISYNKQRGKRLRIISKDGPHKAANSVAGKRFGPIGVEGKAGPLEA